MANQYINALTDLWNNAGTTYEGIKLNVTNSASASDSKLLRLQIGGVDVFSVAKTGAVVATGALSTAGITASATVLPSADDGAALGASGTAWSDLFLASGGVINWNAGDVTLTHSGNALAFAGASSGYSFDTKLVVGHTANLSIGGNADNIELFGTDAATSGLAIGAFSATPAVSGHLDFYKSANASIGSATVVASGERLGAINFYGAQQTGTFATQNPAAQIRAEVDGTVTSGGSADMPGRIVFGTTADAAGTITDRLILDAAGTLKPSTNDGVALGTAALSFADLFLASGAVINFANGNVAITHSAGTLTFSGSPTIAGIDASETAKGLIEIAIASEIAAMSSNTLAMTPGRLKDSLAWYTITYASTIPVNHQNGLNQKVTVTGNGAFGAPSNGIEGAFLDIWVVQDGSGGHVPTWNSVYDFGDFGTPAGSTGAGQGDVYSFKCLTSSKYVFYGMRRRAD